MQDKKKRSLEEIVLGDLVSMCWNCDWREKGRCKGIEKGDVQKGLIVIKTQHFAVIGEVLSIPRCPKIPINFQSN
jgi:hypothetical protein